MLWPTDPHIWPPAVEAWTTDLDLGPDDWEPVARNAFGTMRVWSPSTGVSLTIHPARGWIFPARGPIAPLGEVGPDDVDVFDVDDKPLLLRARDRLGPVGPDTLYAFAPPLGQGGEPRLEALRITEAVPHVLELAAVTERTIFPDVSRA
ncbi:MAG TPA: GAD-like domain-containing protein [Iamia sp.]